MFIDTAARFYKHNSICVKEIRLNRNIKLLNYIIYLSLLFFTFVDTFTGVSLNSGGISFSIPYKIFVLMLMVCVVAVWNYNYFLYILFFITFLFFSMLFMVITASQTFSLAVQIYTKLLMVFVYYLYFSLLLKREKNVRKHIRNIVVVNALVFFVNIALGLMGFGYKAYKSANIGTTGFFYAGNEIFLVLLAIMFLLMQSRRKNAVRIVYVLSMLCAISIASKSAILSVLILICFNVFLGMRRAKRIFTFLLLTGIGSATYSAFFALALSFSVFQHIADNINRTKELSGSLGNALLSNRLTFFHNTMTLWEQEHTFGNVIFGGSRFFDEKGIEIDFFDVLILNGGVIACLFLFFYLFLLFRAICNRNLLLFIFNTLIFGISFTAGHVWMNVTGGIFFIIANLASNVFNVNRQRKI